MLGKFTLGVSRAAHLRVVWWWMCRGGTCSLKISSLLVLGMKGSFSYAGVRARKPSSVKTGTLKKTRIPSGLEEDGRKEHSETCKAD